MIFFLRKAMRGDARDGHVLQHELIGICPVWDETNQQNVVKSSIVYILRRSVQYNKSRSLSFICSAFSACARVSSPSSLSFSLCVLARAMCVCARSPSLMYYIFRFSLWQYKKLFILDSWNFITSKFWDLKCL